MYSRSCASAALWLPRPPAITARSREGAVEAFQREAGLSVDGIVGDQTYGRCCSATTTSASRRRSSSASRAKCSSPIGTTINKLWKKGTTATVTDVRTGLQYTPPTASEGGTTQTASRLTAADTAIMKKDIRRPAGRGTGGRSGSRSANGVTYAASQHGMPHMADPVIADNDFPGHFCIHFYHSKVHETSAECPRHQSCVTYAYNAAH